MPLCTFLACEQTSRAVHLDLDLLRAARLRLGPKPSRPRGSIDSMFDCGRCMTAFKLPTLTPMSLLYPVPHFIYPLRVQCCVPLRFQLSLPSHLSVYFLHICCFGPTDQLNRGEQTAQALENNLSSLEHKIDTLLASFEAGQSGVDASSTSNSQSGQSGESVQSKEEDKKDEKA
jgi:hypothetical protein